MKFPLFKRVALRADVPKYKLCRGDVATIVEYHPHPDGETIAVITLAESEIEPLMSNEVLRVRNLTEVA